MKILMTLTALLLTTSLMATEYKADVFNTNVRIQKDSLKCSWIAGKIKMKLHGLEDDLGRMGTRTFKAVKRYSESCKTMIGRIKQKLEGRRAPLDAAVTYQEKIIFREIHRDNDSKFDKRDVECQKIMIKTANIRLPQIILEDKPVHVKREERTTKVIRYGSCRF